MLTTPRVCLIAGPLVARSGVYGSLHETVASARAMGWDWSGFVAVSPSAPRASAGPAEGVQEILLAPHGLRGVRRMLDEMQASQAYLQADVVISMTPQTDMAMSLTRRRWVAYMRGLPWPDRGEASLGRRVVWQFLERASLLRAAETWTTTSQLASDLPFATIRVPAGVRPRDRVWDGRGAQRRRVVWAARFDHDKNPELFVEICRGLDLQGDMHGVGPLQDSVAAGAPGNVTVGGWVAQAELWQGTLAYVGTSHREAFGRSAVEAAMSGVPVVVSDVFGCADQLYTDDRLRSKFVLPPTGALPRWKSALAELAADERLRAEVSDHVHANAMNLTIQESARAIHDRVIGLSG